MRGRLAVAWLSLLVALSALSRAGAAEVSYHREIAPLLARHCRGCHHPGKAKGGIDLTRVSAIVQGGRHGPGLVAGDPGASRLIAEVGGLDPAMPKEGERLAPVQVALLERWIREGAHDDSPPPPARRTGPPAYAAPPILGPLEFTADDRGLLVAGPHEVVVFDATTLRRQARWGGGPPRIEALRLSPDGRRLAVAGGEPGVSGELQVRDADTGREWVRAVVSPDTLLGVDWSPDGRRLVVGGADRAVRILDASDGAEQWRTTVHSDWVMGVGFVDGGGRVVSGGRDRALRLLEASDGRMLEVLNQESEPVVRLVRRPASEQVLMAGGEARARLYLAGPKPPASDPGQDPNRVREYDAFPDGTTALAVSPDGRWMAVAGGSPAEVRVHETGTGRRVASLKDLGGPVYGLAFPSDGQRLATAGFDGRVRVFAMPAGNQVAGTEFPGREP